MELNIKKNEDWLYLNTHWTRGITGDDKGSFTIRKSSENIAPKRTLIPNIASAMGREIHPSVSNFSISGSRAFFLNVHMKKTATNKPSHSLSYYILRSY